MNAPSVSIPLPLFDEQQLEHYLKTAVEKDEKTTPQKNVLKASNKLLSLMLIPRGINYLKKYFPK